MSQGTIHTIIGVLGTLMSSSVIYFLLYRRVRLAKCQSLFIINLSVSDVIVSILGIFRGLGIIDGRFVGAVNNVATPYCAVYVLFLYSFGCSNLIALLPLTIDRAVAVVFPLQHGSLITHKTSVVMIGAVWSGTLIVLINDLVSYYEVAITAVYLDKYYRCILTKTWVVESLALYIFPFMLILLMYGCMLFVIVKTKRSCGRFLLLSTAIIGTNMLCFTPSIITLLVTLDMSYEATQILFVTVWYANGIFNPLVYFLSHPRTRELFRSSSILTKLGL